MFQLNVLKIALPANFAHCAVICNLLINTSTVEALIVCFYWQVVIAQPQDQAISVRPPSPDRSRIPLRRGPRSIVSDRKGGDYLESWLKKQQQRPTTTT